jgi:hypothetical protein
MKFGKLERADNNFVYELEDTGNYRKGVPEQRNRISFQIQGPAENAEYITQLTDLFMMAPNLYEENVKLKEDLAKFTDELLDCKNGSVDLREYNQMAIVVEAIAAHNTQLRSLLGELAAAARGLLNSDFYVDGECFVNVRRGDPSDEEYRSTVNFLEAMITTAVEVVNG